MESIHQEADDVPTDLAAWIAKHLLRCTPPRHPFA